MCFLALALSEVVRLGQDSESSGLRGDPEGDLRGGVAESGTNLSVDEAAASTKPLSGSRFGENWAKVCEVEVSKQKHGCRALR